MFWRSQLCHRRIVLRENGLEEGDACGAADDRAAFAHTLTGYVKLAAEGPLIPGVSAMLTLILDGGGVRGFSMLIILRAFIHRAAQELEEMIMRDQGWTKAELEEHMPQFRSRPRPCDYFDLIAGTGTGGLIAIMFGRLRMNVDDCITVYTQMTKYVFETDKTIVGIPYRSTLFKASKLENAIQDCVNRFDGHEEEAFFGRDPDTPASGLPRRSTSSAWPRRNSLRLNTPSSPVSSRYTFNEPFTFKDERPHATKT